jgi:transcriptional regulator with XRE-family HTH domain
VNQQQPQAENKRFGMYLRRIREERRLSLDAVEELSLGLSDRVTKSHLSRIENGQAIPSFPRMFSLSQIYGVPVSSLAERFELCLKADLYPAEAATEPLGDLDERAERLRISGRHGEALVLYEAQMHRSHEIPEQERQNRVTDLRIRIVNCLVKLSRFVTAKDECETLLGTALTSRQRVETLQLFAICCYRLGRYPVALMAVEKAEAESKHLENAEALVASLCVLEGNLHAAVGSFDQAAEAYRDSMGRFEALSMPFEACRAKVNVGACLIERCAHDHARRVLLEVLEAAEAAGYDRQRAYALSHLGLLAFREDDLEAAETYCLRSNRLARPREYVPILFRNCYYLWRIAQLRQDEAGVRSNERTLRTYLSRVERQLPEVDEFRAWLGRGDHE